ncbi:MAG: hypothetical protein HRT89_10075, partial [Lentisphaeria bacterium]|nr:hypothetical protein [Lentisphaeria bacterium]
KLEKASLEMALVIRQLDKLMTATGLEEKRRIYRALLQDIIDDQWMMLRDTVSWGRVLLEDGKTGNVGPDLSQGQYLLNEKFGTYVFDIKLDLKTAVEGEELAKLITQLLVCFVKTQVDTQQKKAAEAITVKDPAQSAGNQQAALKGLHAAMDILNGVDPNMAERAEAIASILMEIKLIVEKERALRLTIVRGGNEKFKKTNGAHLKEQHVITAMLKKIADDKPPVGEDILNAIAKALKEMGKAEKYIGDVKRKPAMGAQMRAIFILEEILETLDSLEMAGHMAEGAEGLMEFGMGEASGQSLSGETDMGVGMGSGMEAEMGIGGEGEGEGEGEGGEGMPEGLSDLPPMSAEEVTIGEVRTGDGVIGKNVFTSGKQSKGHLDMNARKHVQQLYQESLPPEFRGMAQDYFEVLGAEE